LRLATSRVIINIDDDELKISRDQALRRRELCKKGRGAEMDVFNKLVSSIYDCAANPELWVKTLTELRDHMGAAYAMVGMTDIEPLLRGEPPVQNLKFSPWSVESIQSNGRYLEGMPGFLNLFNTEVDQPWVQMWECSEADFQNTVFYQEWAKPQGLRDAINVPFLRRPTHVGVLTITVGEGRGLVSKAEAEFATQLTPHIRRAIAINDLVDKNKLALALYKRVLDSLSTAIFVVGRGSKIELANAAAEALLSEGRLLRRVNGELQVARAGEAAGALEDALARSAKGDVAIGIKGIGIPLVGDSGERAAAYVLPISGADVRGAMGNGYCIVFVARRNEQLPMTIEVLRTVFDMSQAEARVAALIAKGDSAEAIAEALGTSINTVRSQIAGALAKAGVNNQVALVACINELVPPMAG
jgi:DNA-binding CsgD family transcriptional regulator/PAS domain-containing protein